MSDNNLHFNHFVNYYPQNYWPYQATQNDSLRHPSIQLPSKINHSDFNLNVQSVIPQNNRSTKNCFNKEANNHKYISINELEEAEEIDEATNKTIDDEIIDETINVIDDEEDSSCITELWTQ
ncbi:unnamed protein product [Rhizophagus irregularis]|nr:unnamed protein product [Rhizophagus irregularis]